MDRCLKTISEQFNLSELQVRNIIKTNVILNVALGIHDVIDASKLREVASVGNRGLKKHQGLSL